MKSRARTSRRSDPLPITRRPTPAHPTAAHAPSPAEPPDGTPARAPRRGPSTERTTPDARSPRARSTSTPTRGDATTCADEPAVGEHALPALDEATAGFSPHERAVPSDPVCLLLGSPREVLARIVAGDPLDVRAAVADVLRAECVFLDADRVHLRALARVARAASRFAASRTDLAAWIRTEVAGAVAEILREEYESRPPDPGTAFTQFARPLGLDPEAIRRGCIAFNRLPHSDRFAFCALVVRNVGLDALARETGIPPSELGRRARRGLDAVLHANHPELAPAAGSAAAVQVRDTPPPRAVTSTPPAAHATTPNASRPDRQESAR